MSAPTGHQRTGPERVELRPLPPAAATPANLSDRQCGPDCRTPDQTTGPTLDRADQHARGAYRDTGWQRAARQARALSWLSLAWMSAEGVLGLIAGTAAGSISLLGWALGSVIEGLASIIVIWRFTGRRTLSETAEHRADRAVAVSFFLLAPYLAVEGVRDLATGHTATATALGVAVTTASLIAMPLLGVAKRRLAVTLDSGATAGEGVQNLICAAQAGAVLVGLAATATLGWRWVDPTVALLLAAWAIREGLQAWRGHDCC